MNPASSLKKWLINKISTIHIKTFLLKTFVHFGQKFKVQAKTICLMGNNVLAMR